MFEKLKEKFADIIEKIFLKVEKSRERQKQKITARREAYLEAKRRERVKQEREAIKNINKANQQTSEKLRRTFTTIEEYKKIAGAKLTKLEKLPQHERDVVTKRVMKLRSEDETFRQGLEAWVKQNYELPQRTKSVSSNNKSTSNIIEI